MEVELYDTTLRDGAQREGISLSVADKLNIARELDTLGIHYIEGGWPGSNPKDSEFFSRSGELKLKSSRLVAFGSTRRPGIKAEDDPTISLLISSGVDAVALVGKTSARHVSNVLETSLDENVSMVADSIRFFRNRGITVFLDAEHFFDGFKSDPVYSLRVLQAASENGVDAIVLCDTNGGSLPDEVAEAVAAAIRTVEIPIGIHAHNDAELAVANTLAAVKAGASQVQGTINGYGERCGNANLCSIIPALKIKMGLDCISDEQLMRLTEISRSISELANLKPDAFMPYVGASAFSHKAGLHVSGVRKWAESYQHIDPARVGNRTKMLISELAGKSNIVERAKQIGVPLAPRGNEAKEILEKVKNLENRGFQYENAEASFDLLVHRNASPDYKPPFDLIDYMVVVEKARRPGVSCTSDDMLSEAMVKVKINGEVMHTVAEGNGPVNALDNALRKALQQYYPGVSHIKLIDYKVRILDESTGTESQVRVLIESSDGVNLWRTVGSSGNIIEASWLALADSLEYWIMNNNPAR